MSNPNNDSSPDASVSPFALQNVFPDAQGIFTARYRTVDEIKDSCFVALDANVLLLPYKLAEVSLPDVIDVYRPLAAAGMLAIPAQAAREFAKHRSAKIAELVQYLRTQASMSGPDLKKKAGALVGHGGYDAAKAMVADVAESVKGLQVAINKIADEIAANVGEDPVSTAYREVFANAVTADPVPKADEKAFIKELEERYAAGRPPGYKDKSKPDGGAGDLMIWKSILAEGAARKIDCIFVTGDEKSDWYVQSSGPFQPRLELLEEYRSASGGTLHILPLSGLLKTLQAPPETVKDVEQAEIIEAAVEAPWVRDTLTRLRRYDEIKRELAVIDAEIRDTDDALVKGQISLKGLPPPSGNMSLPWERVWADQNRGILGLIERKQRLFERRAELERQ